MLVPQHHLALSRVPINACRVQGKSACLNSQTANLELKDNKSSQQLLNGNSLAGTAVPGLPYFSSAQLLSRVRLCDPMDCSTSDFPVLHHLSEFAQTHVH